MANSQSTKSTKSYPKSKITGHGIADQVRQCIHRPTLQLCTFKTISKNRIRRRRKDQIQLDIAFLKQVNYPNIVSLYDVYEDESEVHIVTELWRDGELHDKIDKHDQQLRVVFLCYREEDAARITHSLSTTFGKYPTFTPRTSYIET